MQRGLERQERAQGERIDQASALMDELVEMGFERADVPDDLTEAEATGLEIQVAAARGEWDVVDQQINWAMEQLTQLPASTRQLVYDMRKATNEDVKHAYLTAILRLGIEAWHKRMGFQRTKPKGE